MWHTGLKEWQPAGSIPKLFDELPPDFEPEDPQGIPPFQTSELPATPTAANGRCHNSPNPIVVGEINPAVAESAKGSAAKSSGSPPSKDARAGIAIAACAAIVFFGLLCSGPLKSLLNTNRSSKNTTEVSARGTASFAIDEKARDTCIGNLRNIDGAMMLCRLEHGISGNSSVTANQIISVIRSYPNPENRLHCPSGGKYKFGSGEPISCSIPEHQSYWRICNQR